MDTATVVRECGCVMRRGVACPHGHGDGEVVVLQVEPRLLDVPSAAALLGVNESTVWELVDRGSGPLRSVKIGRRRLIPLSAVDAYVADLERKAS